MSEVIGNDQEKVGAPTETFEWSDTHQNTTQVRREVPNFSLQPENSRWRNVCGCIGTILNVFIMLCFPIFLIGFWERDSLGLDITFVFWYFTFLAYSIIFAMEDKQRTRAQDEASEREPNVVRKYGWCLFVLHLACASVGVFFTFEGVKDVGYTNLVNLSIIAEIATLFEILWVAGMFLASRTS